jgi:putative protease
MPPPSPKPELLAPAGREDVFHAVLEAGADAVYLAGKTFNMRRHRSDYNFGEADLARLVQTAHAAQRRVYVTVNILVGDAELGALHDTLRFLEQTGADALIVQDLAVLHACRELGLRLPLHASTMMNVGSVAHARWLKAYGVSRVVTSRDLTLDAVRRIREQAEIEVEYFVHGDLCAVQSGQCLLSGIVFGKSSNRGQCMKPCRWAYDLVSLASGAVLAEASYLLAAKDMCLVQHLPALVSAGIDSLKIEGRMRSAETLRPIVALYREQIDRLAAEPTAAPRQRRQSADLQRRRVRNLTTGFAFRSPGADFMDRTGEREPIFLSRSGRLHTVAEASPLPPAGATSRPRLGLPALAAVVGTLATAEAALAAGAGHLVLCWEGDLTPESSWLLADTRALAESCDRRGIPLAMSTPRVCTDADLGELERFVAAAPWIAEYRLTTPAPLRLLQQAGRRLWAGSEMNVLNRAAAALLAAEGVARLTPGLECGLDEAAAMAPKLGALALDLVVYGALPAMVVEHCLIAMATQGIGKDDICQMPCMADRFALRDRRGNLRPVRADRHCRNHILLEHTLCVLPALDRFLALAPASLSLDLRLCTPLEAARVLQAFRQALAEPMEAERHYLALCEASPQESFTYGAYPMGCTGDAAISRLDLVREERDADHP